MSVRNRSTFKLAGMDCPTEEQLVRIALSQYPGGTVLDFDLADRRLVVDHDGLGDDVLALLVPLGFGARLESTAAVTGPAPEAPNQSRMLWAVLLINAAMFVVELSVGLWARSTGLLADSVDMLADAMVYGIALAAVGGAAASQRRSARISGWWQLALAALVLAEVIRRAISGGEPISAAMLVVGGMALIANLTCISLLADHRGGGVHMRASWIFTVNDALANLAVMCAGVVVAVTGSAWPDLLAGAGIAALVASGAWRILRMTRSK